MKQINRFFHVNGWCTILGLVDYVSWDDAILASLYIMQQYIDSTTNDPAEVNLFNIYYKDI